MIIGIYLHKIPIDLILFADPGADGAYAVSLGHTSQTAFQSPPDPRFLPVLTTPQNPLTSPPFAVSRRLRIILR